MSTVALAFPAGMSGSMAVLLLAVPVPPEMWMPPAAGADKKNKKREQQCNDQRKLGAVLRRRITGPGVEIEGEGQHQAANEHNR